MAQRPTFNQAWAAFSRVNGSVPHVGRIIGGKVQTNIDGGIFTNACAIRMSYVLNQTSLPVPASAGAVSSGANGAKYLFRASDLAPHLQNLFGKPDLVVQNPTPTSFAGKKGIIVFDVDVWNDASGHVTLWNGTMCADSCYFPVSTRAKLWELN
ncbi:type VI secretion system amidase effector protein Tae4 [Pusillimonas sp. MFBS29]|uniref:type VI secretion system amidase effector protein Tae4 n=1 Tax=Pusillimonas sp. MFBS29 TaxID=2886690 RepID=UPI001D118128|nr:type VI secretion system amidase effector protein Tae4 [Pusillimonas sp. MFBS29]MCC2596367.1 type VI secretion system amidase effector protein Tae4 [Pusillimonas sp. MFBS29]